MAFSGISIISPLFFIIYFFILFVVLSVYRIIICRLLIDYCAKGKHKSYAVFIGGGDNMHTLYEEMESSLAAIYEVVGYFDVTRMRLSPLNAVILVIRTILLILCPKNIRKTCILFFGNG